MECSNEQISSSYNDIEFEYNKDDQVIYLNFQPKTQKYEWLNAYPADIAFDKEGEINYIAILWPPKAWKIIEGLTFPKNEEKRKLTFKGMPENDDIYSSEIYTNDEYSTLCIELNPIQDKSFQRRSEIHLVTNKNCYRVE